MAGSSRTSAWRTGLVWYARRVPRTRPTQAVILFGARTRRSREAKAARVKAAAMSSGITQPM